MYLKEGMRRAFFKVGLDVRRSRSKIHIVNELTQISIESQHDLHERIAAHRLLSGLNQFLQIGVTPKGQLLQDAFALGSSELPGYFVEIGAGDPEQLSNVVRLIDNFGWKGIRVDPNPEFAMLHRQSAHDGVIFFDCAIGESDGEEMDLVVAGELSSRIDLAGNDGHAASRRKAMRGGAIVRVPVRRLDSLMVEASSPKKIQYLSIDTEGAETEVLRTFPFDTIDVEAVTIEHNFRNRSLHEFDEVLGARGFVRVLGFLSAWDAWYLNSREVLDFGGVSQ